MKNDDTSTNVSESPDSETLRALELAISNNAQITGLLGASYPNGHTAHGTCRDIPMKLSIEQSAEVYRAISAILKD